MTSTQPLILAEGHGNDLADRPFFTSQQFAALSGQQQEAIRRIVQNERGMAELPDRLTMTELDETLRILRPCRGRCVPEACLGDDLLQNIRAKFHTIFCPALRWARERLADRGYSYQRLLELVLVIEPSFEDRSQIVVVDDTPDHLDHAAYCHLYQNPKAWDWSFANLTAVANAVINFRDEIVEEFLRRNGRRSV